jgi:hypothetical protein
VVWVVVTADWVVAVFWVGVPGEPPASVDVAVALADEDGEGGDERQLADVRSDPGPELVAVPREDMLEVGLEPARQLETKGRTERGQIGIPGPR